MRWVKHMTAAWDDERIAKLVGKGGIEGLAAYGVWWRLIEIIASRVDGKSTQCSVTYDVTRWSLLLSLRGSHVRHWLEKLALTGILTAEWVGTEITVTIPKLLKYRDEYSKKSVHSPAQEKEKEKKKSTDIDKPPISSADAAEERLRSVGWEGVSKTPEKVCDEIADLDLKDFPESNALTSPFMIISRLRWFNDFMAFYWRQDDKRKARVKYFEKVISREIQKTVEQAVINQTAEMMQREKQHRKLAATWLHGECWLNEVKESYAIQESMYPNTRTSPDGYTEYQSKTGEWKR